MTRVNKTGAAHAGLIEWLIQRLTAVYMALFLIFLFTQVSADFYTTYEQWAQWFNGSMVRWAWMIFYISVLWHSWIGLRSVFLDYIKPFWLRLTLTLVTAMVLFVHAMWLVDILYIRTAGIGSLGGGA